MTVNALQAGGYWLFSGMANIGDWASVINGQAPHWLWRMGLGLLGVVAYLTVIRFSLRELGVFLSPPKTIRFLRPISRPRDMRALRRHWERGAAFGRFLRTLP
jgi:hypothetical protein